MWKCIAFCALWMMCLALGNANEPKIVCYYGSWAAYRNGSGKLDVPDIDPTLCTHLIFAFVGITEDGGVRVLDPYIALPDNWGKAGFRKFNALRKSNPNLKTLVSTGGWDEGSAKYSKVAADSSLRAKYAKNVVDFVLRHEFNGFDISWQYPTQHGGRPDDVQNFVLLLKELRESFDQHDLILTAAVGASEMFARAFYDIPQISKYLDFINLLSYDYHGAWAPTTAHCAPLYPAARETGDLARTLNVNATIHYWLKQGAPAEKLVLGIPLYGTSFTLKNSKETVPGSQASGPGQEGPYTRQKGFLGFNEICEIISQDKWTSAWDEEQHMPYAHAGNQWISYDNIESVSEKGEYAKSMGLGGVMVWSLETDDHQGRCGERYSLLQALNRAVRGTIVRASSINSDRDAKRVCETTKRKYIRHSHNCAKFWICLKIREHEVIAEPFTCYPGLFFDIYEIICKSKNSVDCS